MKKQKNIFLDIFFDILLLGGCLLISVMYWTSGNLLKGLAFGVFAALTVWSLVTGPISAAGTNKFEMHSYLRMIRILVGGFLLICLGWDRILSMPITGTGIIILWLGISRHTFLSHNAIRSLAKNVKTPVRQSIASTLPGEKFTAADLTPGKKYHVVAEFTDYIGNVHPVGERWQFIEKHFLPHEDGLTLCTKKDGQDFWIQLQWRKETQGALIDNFFAYVQEAEGKSD